MDSSWLTKISKASGKTYYFNVKTGQSLWEKPGEKNAPAQSSLKFKKPGSKMNAAHNKPQSGAIAKREIKQVPRGIRQKKLEEAKASNRPGGDSNQKFFRVSSKPEPVSNDATKCSQPNINDKNRSDAKSNSRVPNKCEKSLHALNVNMSKKISKPRIQQKNIAEKRMNALRSEISSGSDNVNFKSMQKVQSNMQKVQSNIMQKVQNNIIQKGGNSSKTQNLPTSTKTSKSATPVESMDWETIVGEVIQARVLNQRLNSDIIIETRKKSNQYTNDSVKSSIYVVIDTNIFLSHLETVEKLVDMNSECYQFIVVVPWRVFCELDSMKKVNRRDNSSNVSIDHLARRALGYLHENLPTNDRLTGQSLKEASNHIYTCSTPDDEILNCCLQYSNSEKSVILLSNDKNLCNKGFINNIESHTHEKFIPNVFNKYLNERKSPPPVSIREPVVNNIEPKIMTKPEQSTKSEKFTNPDPSTKYEDIEKLLKGFLATFLENEMKSRYESLWKDIVYIKPPWTLGTILRCISKHWVAVFSEIFPSELQNFLRELQYFYPLRRKVAKMSSKDLKSVVSSASQLIKHLEKTPKYKIDAANCRKAMSDVIQNLCGTSSIDDVVIKDLDEDVVFSDSTTRVTGDNVQNHFLIPGRSNDLADTSNENLSILDDEVSNSLLFIWNGFCGFCSQLAYHLGVPHCIEQRNTTETPFTELLSQANSVANQLKALIEIISRVLVTFPLEAFSPEYKLFEANQVSDRFYKIVFDTAVGMGQNGLNFEKESLIDYCCRRRDILEDGFNKFLTLQKLLEDCSLKYSNM